MSNENDKNCLYPKDNYYGFTCVLQEDDEEPQGNPCVDCEYSKAWREHKEKLKASREPGACKERLIMDEVLNKQRIRELLKENKEPIGMAPLWLFWRAFEKLTSKDQEDIIKQLEQSVEQGKRYMHDKSFI